MALIGAEAWPQDKVDRQLGACFPLEVSAPLPLKRLLISSASGDFILDQPHQPLAVCLLPAVASKFHRVAD